MMRSSNADNILHKAMMQAHKDLRSLKREHEYDIEYAISNLRMSAEAAAEAAYDEGRKHLIQDAPLLSWIHGEGWASSDLIAETPLNTYVIMLQPTCCILQEVHGAIIGKYKTITDAKVAANNHLRDGIRTLLGVPKM